MTHFMSLFRRAINVASIGPIALFISLTSLQKIAQAQISITPQVVELDLKRGQAQGSILMINGSPLPLDTKSYIGPFTYDREGGFRELKDSPQDLTPYLQLYPLDITLAATEQRRSRFVVRLAPNLPDGEYRAMIFTALGSNALPKGRPLTNTTTFEVKYLPRIGVAVYVRKGDISPKISVENVQWDANKSQVKILVKNSGKASSILRGEWTLKQDNKTIKEGLIQETTVIAESDRSMNLPMLFPNDATMQKLTPGRYQIEGNIFSRNQTFPYQTSFEVTANNK